MRILIFILALTLSMMAIQSCKEVIPEAGFEDMIRMTIFDYIVENEESFSKFKQILEAGELDKTVSAYNPNGNNYTLFLPTNDAIDKFIAESSLFTSFEELLNDKKYVSAMARYHVINMGIITNDFPFGALPELNLSGQNITIGFEMGEDSSYYKINNVAPLVFGNIEVSNGYIHIISEALTPITFTSYQWLEQNPNFSIFFEAVNATGYQEVLSRIVSRDTVGLNPITLFIEPDSVYHRYNIFNFTDLVNYLQPFDNDYTNEFNALNNYVGYHILESSYFLSDFEGTTSNYNTFGGLPVDIHGEGLDLLINTNKIQTGYTINTSGDTTKVYLKITFYYDFSNNLTQSGAIHVINQIMTPQAASPRDINFEFFEEPQFNLYREKAGEYLVEDQTLLNFVSWTGGNDRIVFIRSDEEEEEAWNRDYLMIEGDFSITYRLPKIVPGTYNLFLRAHAIDTQNALVEVFFDGVKIGGLIDLTTLAANHWSYYYEVNLGTVNLLTYDNHDITVRSLIPGILKWDAVIFRIPK